MSDNPEKVKIKMTPIQQITKHFIEKFTNEVSKDENQDNINSDKPTETTTNDDDENKSDDDGTTVTMTIRLLPNRTRHIVIAASYTQVSSSTKEGIENDGNGITNKTTILKKRIDALTVKNRPMSLPGGQCRIKYMLSQSDFGFFNCWNVSFLRDHDIS